MWPTHTDKPQTMQESRSWLVLEMTRTATMLDNPEGSIRESGLLVKATENPTEITPPHIHTHVTYQPIHNRSTMIYDVQVQCY